MNSAATNNKVLIWDWPIRIFHWAFALCLGGALAFALLAEGGGKLFVWHMLLGIVACFLLIIRLALGLFGSRHNRFRAMLFSPAETFRYCWSIVTFRPIHYVAHNPGASAAALGMYGSVVGLFWSGLKAESATAMHLHTYLAYVLLVLAIAHLAGVTSNAIHSRGEAALAMFHGRRTGAPTEGLATARPLAGLFILLLTTFVLGSLFTSYDAVKGRVLGVSKEFFQASEK